MGDIVVVAHFAVDSHLLNIAIVGAIVSCCDVYGVAILKMQFHAVEIRSTHNILVRAWAHRIEAKGREHIPRRGLTIVFVATIAIRVSCV